MQEELKKRRECPVPKPGGLVGKVLGVRKTQGSGTERMEVMVEEGVRIGRIAGSEGDGKG